MVPCQQSRQRVLIVDDHELTRFNLQFLLRSQDNIEVVGLASNGKEAVELVKTHRPTVAILDLQMPLMDGLSAATHMKQIEPNLTIIAYSSVDDPQIEVMIQTAPMDAFCPKDIAPEKLLDIIEELGQKTQVKPNKLSQGDPRNQ
ncbi:MAG: response regulator transcription factor [Cyanobacteriota bacterium]|nr:response regulator transcription factor [Cyanobacteriota bacterium]